MNLLSGYITLSSATDDIKNVEDGRFIVIPAEKDTSLYAIIEHNGYVYEKGRAYYEFVRDDEVISEEKEIILMDKASINVVPFSQNAYSYNTSSTQLYRNRKDVESILGTLLTVISNCSL